MINVLHDREADLYSKNSFHTQISFGIQCRHKRFLFYKVCFPSTCKKADVSLTYTVLMLLETTPMVTSYAAAKAAVLSLARSTSIEAKAKGIRVNAILTGAIDTPML